MNTITFREYRETERKYAKLRSRVDKRIKNGSFYQLTKKKQRNLIYRIRKLYERLLRLKNLLKLATAGATMSLLLTAGQADAQKIAKPEFLKKFKTEESAGTKAYESSIFVQMTGSENPFGGTNPFSGNIISQPWLANYADIDNDGDLDVFSIYEDNNSGIFMIKYYKNTGDNTNAVLEEQFGPNNPADGIFFGNTPYISFADIDNDGDLDVFLTDQDNTDFFFAKNIGNAENPYFVPKTGSDNPLNGIDPQYMNRLSFADIDNDGDLDVFIGTNANYPVLYRNTGDAENPTFVQEDASSFFNNTSGILHTILLKDLDGDGDLDGLLNGNRYFENQGNSTTPNFVEITGNSNPFENINNLSGYLPELIDLDADSDFDLIFGSYSGGINYYKNIGTVNTAVFEDTNGGIDSTYYTMPDFVDIDNDGDYDMFTGVYNAASGAFKYAYYKNTGTNSSPVFEKQAWADNPLSAIEINSFIPAIKFTDIDNDEDFDVFIGGYNGGDLRYFKNTGTADNPAFTEQTGADNPLPGISNPLDFDFVDIDNDGDFDFFYGSSGLGLEFYRNTGTASAPVFTNETSPVTLPDTWAYLFPEFTDVDNDGDYDLFAGGVDYDIGDWRVMYAENKGSADTPDFEAQLSIENPLNLTLYLPSLSFVDIDNDGDEDAFIGTYDGTLYYFKNKTVTTGVENVTKLNNLSVFPNPAKDEIKLDLSSFNKSEVKVSIFDITGKTIADYNMQNTDKIDVSNLKSGIYFIKASDLHHSETAKLIVK